MAYVAPTTRTTGTLITAAIWNQDVVDNIIAMYAGALSVASQAAGDILKASSATQWARLAIGAAGQVLGISAGAPAWVNTGRVKVATFTRANATADGNAAVTGVGFLPAVVVIIAGVSGGAGASVGIMIAATAGCIYWDSAAMVSDTTRVAWSTESAGVYNRATPVSLDADGFTLAWAKSGAPAGTITCTYVAVG